MNTLIPTLKTTTGLFEAALQKDLPPSKQASNLGTVFIGYTQMVLSACRTEEGRFSELLAQAVVWRERLLTLDSLDIGLGIILGDILSQAGYLFNHTPHPKEIEYIQVCRNSSDLLNPLSAISYNLYLGDPPDKDLPTKFDKRLQKDVEATLALLDNPQKGIAAAEKMWDRRKNANMHRWYGTGPAHDYLLDPLILCILKYHKADFEFDSIHMKGYRFLVKNGF
jgi:hypothetical protein